MPGVRAKESDHETTLERPTPAGLPAAELRPCVGGVAAGRPSVWPPGGAAGGERAALHRAGDVRAAGGGAAHRAAVPRRAGADRLEAPPAGEHEAIPAGLWGPAAVTALGAVLYFALLPQSFDPNMGYMETVYIAQFGEEVYRAQGGAELLRLSMVSQIAMALTVAPFMNLLFALGEEVGWRGWLYPRLISRLGVTRGVLAGGVIWGLWHLPVTVNGHNYGVGYPGWPVAGVLAMCLFCFSAGVCLCWLTVRSGSIWPAALAHGAINAVGAAGQFFLPAEGANLLFGPAPAGVLAGLPLLALALLALRHLRKLEHTPMPIQTEEL